MQNPSSVVDRKQRMFIWPAGYFTVVHFPEEEVTVLWDRKTTVHIQVGPRWQVGLLFTALFCFFFFFLTKRKSKNIKQF